MKNSIFIDIDTDRANPIAFGKPPEIIPPQTREETQEMVLNDIACISEALAVLISMASLNGYGDKKDLVDASVTTITSVLEDANVLTITSNLIPPSSPNEP